MYKVKFFKILLSTKTFILSKNALIFVFFLFLSFCFWCMQSMRKKYEVEVDVKINYTNVPIKNINIGDLPHTLSATLKEQGFYIFLYKLLTNGEKRCKIIEYFSNRGGLYVKALYT